MCLLHGSLAYTVMNGYLKNYCIQYYSQNTVLKTLLLILKKLLIMTIGRHKISAVVREREETYGIVM